MKKYSSYEIQDISANFRNVARRLSRTDYSQCDANLKRFINILKTEEMLISFIDENNTVLYDIPKIIKERGWLDPFEVSPIPNEEISFSVQLLLYAIEEYDGDFTRLYGTHRYTSTQSTVNDEMRKFIEHIIDPLIDHIAEYLRHCYDEVLRDDNTNKSSAPPSFTAHNSTVVIGSNIGGNVETNVSISETQKIDANELIATIREILDKENVANKDDIKDILQQMQEVVDNDKKPSRGLFTALKVLCQAGTTIIPLVTALSELFA